MGMVGVLYIALAREALLTGASHRREIATQAAAEGVARGILEKELAELRLDRNHYRDAGRAERERADTISAKMTDHVIPLIMGTNKLLEGFTELGRDK